MAEEFQAGICGGTWWNPSKSVFAGCLSPCSTGISTAMGSFGWQNMDVMADMKARSSEEPNDDDNSNNNNNSVSDSSMIFQSIHQKPRLTDSDSGGSSSILIDSTLQMMGFGLSSSSSDWNQSVLRGDGGRDESTYNSMLQENMSSRFNYRQETGIADSSQHHQIQKDWSGTPKSLTTSTAAAEELSSINNAFKPINQEFSSGLSGGFEIGSSASYGYPSTLIQSLFEPDPPQPVLHQSILFNSQSMNYNISSTNCSNDQLSPSWPKMIPYLKPSLPKQQPQPNGLHFANNTPFWNASAPALNDIRANFLSSQFLVPNFEDKPKCLNLTTKCCEEVRDLAASMVKKGRSEPAFKRPRIETPSPLPTFKVRKEKLGDRITALQQLVSPFGKTDTASVLHEAIEYIKFLHDQVSVLSTPYMKQGAPIQHQQSIDKLKDLEREKSPDLRSRGLCLVPISSTFPVANETTADFWTPTFAATFR